MNSKLKTILYGGPLKYPISDPEVIIGDSTGKYANGVLMDANKIQEIINKEIQKLIGDSPSSLDTLYELADALSDNPMLVKVLNNKFNYLITYGEFILPGYAEFSKFTEDYKYGLTTTFKIGTLYYDPIVDTFCEAHNGIQADLHIPYASSTQDGVISKEDKMKIDKYANDDYINKKLELVVEYDYYGIKWSTDENGIVTKAPVRTGNLMWHRTLPIQSKMRRCMLQDDGTVFKYIDDKYPNIYEDGTHAEYNGEHGQVMVEIPEYYYEAIETRTETGYDLELKLYPFSKKGRKSNKFYISACEAVSDMNSAGKNAKLYSICTTNFQEGDTIYANNLSYKHNAEKFKGGDRSTSFQDNSVKSLLGRPITGITIDEFRNQARRRGDGWSILYWTAYNSILRLYFVEYCNFNSQSDFNNALTEDGYKQGGLGNKCNVADYNEWSAFNSNNPILPTLITKDLGNKTGVFKFIYEPGEFKSTQTIVNVVSYRGIENIFGHVWKNCDGIAYFGDDTLKKGFLYVCEDINKFKNISNDTIHPEDYVLLSNFAPYSDTNSNYTINGILWNERCEFIPKSKGNNTASHYFDNIFLFGGGWRRALLGGCLTNSAGAGLLTLYLSHGFGSASVDFGSRLLYTPEQNIS